MPNSFYAIKVAQRPGWTQITDAKLKMRRGDVVLRDHSMRIEDVVNDAENSDVHNVIGFVIHGMYSTPLELDILLDKPTYRDVAHVKYTVWRKNQVIEQMQPADIAHAIAPAIILAPAVAQVQQLKRFVPIPGVKTWGDYEQITDPLTTIKHGFVFIYEPRDVRPQDVRSTNPAAEGGFVAGENSGILIGVQIQAFSISRYPDNDERKFTVWKHFLHDARVRADEAFLQAVIRPKKKGFTPILVRNKFHSEPLPLP